MRSSRASSRADFLVSAKLPVSHHQWEEVGGRTTWRQSLGYSGPVYQLERPLYRVDRHTD